MSNKSDEDPGVRVGRLVRDLRIAHDMTQDDLAVELGSHLGIPIHKTMVSKIENGSRSINLREAVGLSEVLGVSLRELSAPYTYVGIPGMKSRVIDEMEAVEHSLSRAREDAFSLVGAAGELVELIRAEMKEDHPVPGTEKDLNPAQEVERLAVEVQEALIPMILLVRNEKQACYQAFYPVNGRP